MADDYPETILFHLPVSTQPWNWNNYGFKKEVKWLLARIIVLDLNN